MAETVWVVGGTGDIGAHAWAAEMRYLLASRPIR